VTLPTDRHLADPLLVVERRHDGDAAVVAPRGEIDLASIAELRRALGAAVAAGGDVVVDLGDVSFLDSSGLSVLVAFHRQLAALDRRFTLRRASGSLLRLFQIAGLDSYLTIERPATEP
jgi:anti-anti-sigma factor